MHKIVSLRSKEGEFATLFAKLRMDEIKFFNYFRMSVESFDELLSYGRRTRPHYPLPGGGVTKRAKCERKH